MKYFVYRFVDPIANEVFYIGKGSGQRIQTHFAAAKRNVRSHLYNRINKLKLAGADPEVEYIWECDDENEALRKEIEFIKLYGRRADGSGTLCNITIGGEGCSLTGESLERRNKAISKSLKGRKRTPETSKKISQSKRKFFVDNPEVKEVNAAILAIARARVDEDKRRAAVAKAASERIWTEESRSKLSKSCMGRRYSADVIDRMRDSKTKPVICHNTGDVFKNGHDAAKAMGVGYKSVWRVCNGKYDSVKGYKFSYME